jgi:HD-like signal output (HDOD) protein
MTSVWKKAQQTAQGHFASKVAIKGGDAHVGPTELSSQLVKKFKSPEYKPPVLPRVAMEILRITQDSNVRLSQIERLLEEDQMVAARVLRVARSPLYSPAANAAKTLKAALVRLGLNALRDIVLDVSLQMRVFKSKAFVPEMERVARHSRATAYIARLVASQTFVPGEHAFLCGLFHDVGIAGALITMGEQKHGQREPDVGQLWPAIDQAHQKLSGIMAEIWEMPPEVKYVVGRHHSIVDQGQVHPLCAVVCVAEHLANTLGRAIGPAPGPGGTELSVDTADHSMVQRALVELQFDKGKLSDLQAAARDMVSQLST